MHLVRHADGIPYVPADHRGVLPLRLQGAEAGGPSHLTVSLSRYPPGSGSDTLVPAVDELVYLVVSGVIDVQYEAGVVRLERGDSVSFAAGESRAARNTSSADAELIVIHGRAGAR